MNFYTELKIVLSNYISHLLWSWNSKWGLTLSWIHYIRNW